jgi:hypothetical protein
MTAENLAQERFPLTPEMQRPEELADPGTISPASARIASP